tara:strand:+ start:4720 stop:5667 length:948 start_codon:yes stop_codon:yes gene_type:complete
MCDGMDKYVVTGGAGFIGGHIAESLASQGHKVIVVDNLRTGFPANIEHLAVEFVEADIRDRDTMVALADGAKGIFHLAALVSVPESLERIEECLAINVQGTLNILEAAKKSKGCKVVLSSSAAIYGNNPTLPKQEGMVPEPMTPYAVTKLDGEYYLRMYREQWGVPTTSLRYFNVFGPRQNPSSSYAAAVPIFIRQALTDQPLVIYGDGHQTRDFIYVKDIVGANLFAMEQGTEMYNVALGQSTSILELAQQIISITGSRSRIVFENERAGDVKHSRANVTRFADLGYNAIYELDRALMETITYYEQQVLGKQRV